MVRQNITVVRSVEEEVVLSMAEKGSRVEGRRARYSPQGHAPCDLTSSNQASPSIIPPPPNINGLYHSLGQSPHDLVSGNYLRHTQRCALLTSQLIIKINHHRYQPNLNLDIHVMFQNCFFPFSYPLKKHTYLSL
jgi:hypothetical protein